VSAKPTKLYPLAGRYLNDVPHAVHVVATKAQADDLEASGAFTTNANHPDRDPDAPELGSDPITHPRTTYLGEESTTPAESPAEPKAEE
jgi:hypothetical protein